MSSLVSYLKRASVEQCMLFLPSCLYFHLRKAVSFSHLLDSVETWLCFPNFMVYMKEKVQLLYFSKADTHEKGMLSTVLWHF